MDNKALRVYRLGDVSLTFKHRGLLLAHVGRASLMLGWSSGGWDLLWNAEQQCQCAVGKFERLRLDGNRAILGCSACSYEIPYLADVSETKMAMRPVS